MSKISTLKKNGSTAKKMNSIKEFEPEQSSINAILNYSKALSVRPSKHIKHIELILN